ncbi:tyrosine-type recombinase/integrase [Polaribacter sp. HL-MS24]|uniref:tyrosine-type recombinase/integrase n=1 Tax=Polaribacter sp. HL-MS24 TaxID=3077735 RepID=UPI002934699A|nr:tyrosine-type recombinase/integrase [Polaribacter sp. HL-MS24]WOC40602.1 tyrosine-type recombinase/integrase [Polaribacter sp. HL-MS24]
MKKEIMIPAFIEYVALEKNYSQHTVTAYKKDLMSFKYFCESHYAQNELVTVQYPQIRSWIVSMVDQGISNRSINRKISSLRSFYEFLQKTKQIDFNPLTKHKALKVAKRVQNPFSESEINQVIELLAQKNDFDSVRNKLMVELFYTTGIRRSELIHIRLGSVHLSDKLIKVLGKRNKERFVSILPSVVKTLTEYLALRKEVATTLDFLFITNKGNKIYETLVYRVINSYFSEVSTKEKKSPHLLRHSFATHLLNEGADLNSVKELLGHASLASTQVYTHNSIAEMKKVYNQAHPRSRKKE